MITGNPKAIQMNFIKKLNYETDELIKSFKSESYIEFKKREFFKTKDKKNTVGILEINNSCNIFIAIYIHIYFEY